MDENNEQRALRVNKIFKAYDVRGVYGKEFDSA